MEEGKKRELDKFFQRSLFIVITRILVDEKKKKETISAERGFFFDIESLRHAAVKNKFN